MNCPRCVKVANTEQAFFRKNLVERAFRKKKMLDFISTLTVIEKSSAEKKSNPCAIMHILTARYAVLISTLRIKRPLDENSNRLR